MIVGVTFFLLSRQDRWLLSALFSCISVPMGEAAICSQELWITLCVILEYASSARMVRVVVIDWLKNTQYIFNSI